MQNMTWLVVYVFLKIPEVFLTLDLSNMIKVEEISVISGNRNFDLE